MYLYHGSKQSFPKLRKHKAQAPPGRPPEEALEAIYLTPDFLFALFCAAGPPGTNNMGWSETDKMDRFVYFENPDQFEPDETIYIYFIDPTKIPEDKKIYIDPLQVAVTLDEITPDKVETYKSGELLKHHRIVDKFD
ncbi:hypothetical protein J4G08_06040 [Candidatus Poribacteria bacterium]|nr:hypothetical protein [Candidatus Poribacteria bacterium]